MTEKQNAEMLELADRIRDIAYSGVNNFDDFSPYKLDLIQDCAKLLQASLAAPSPHPRGEPVAWPKLIETAPKDGTEFIAHQDGEVYRCCWRIEEPDEGPGRAGWYDFFNESFEDPTEWSPLRYAAPPPAGADAMRAATDQLCVVEADLNCLRATVKQACDLLSEKTNGSAARSPAHNARLLLERAIASIPAPQPQAEQTK